MISGLSASLTIFLVALDGPDSAILKSLGGNNALPVVSQVITAASLRVRGIVLASQVRPGMTAEEADKVIGNLTVEEGQFNDSGIHMVFKSYGFEVTETRNQAGRWIVRSVRLLPVR